MKNYTVTFGYSNEFKFEDITDIVTLLCRVDATTSAYKITIERDEVTNGIETAEAIRTGLNDDYPNL